MKRIVRIRHKSGKIVILTIEADEADLVSYVKERIEELFGIQPEESFLDRLMRMANNNDKG